MRQQKIMFQKKKQDKTSEELCRVKESKRVGESGQDQAGSTMTLSLAPNLSKSTKYSHTWGQWFMVWRRKQLGPGGEGGCGGQRQQTWTQMPRTSGRL